MTEDTNQKPQKETTGKVTSIGRMTFGDVDAALVDCDKTIKTCSDLVKTKLANNSTLPTNVLRELSKANAHKSRLMIRRVALLIENGETTTMELLDKLMRVKPSKGQA